MKLSVLQPAIERGNTVKNTETVQRLVNSADGDLLILAEYALTGSLVLDENADVRKWAAESEVALQKIIVPKDKSLLINSLITKDGGIYNACKLLPADEVIQLKTLPDKTETEAGIIAGSGNSTVQLNGKNILILICSDIIDMEKISTDGADILFFIYHFTAENYERHIANLTKISAERNVPVVAASLTSDKNYGHSAYINGKTVISLGNSEGILEIRL